MLRGINRQIIFEDDQDYEYFINTLKHIKSSTNCKIHAYCLMNNHVHLLLGTKDEELSSIIKRLSSKYVYWYNHKYERVGHLFQERFKSEPVEDSRYFLTVYRYILQNPIKAKLVKNPEEYRWSNCKALFRQEVSVADITDFMEFFQSPESCMKFIRTPDNGDYMDLKEKRRRYSDEDVLQHILKCSGYKSIADLQKTEKTARNELLKRLKKEGISLRQISRVTGITKSAIERA